MPTWGIVLFFTTVIFFTPLAYMQNREMIDSQIANAQNLVNEQTEQLRDIAAQHTIKAVEMSQAAYQEYSAKAQELLGQTKKAAVDKGIVSPETAEKAVPEKSRFSSETTHKVLPDSPLASHDFPTAPKLEPAGQPFASEPAVAPPQPLAS
jgi:hypothetical protein